MQYVYIAADGKRIKLKVQRKGPDVVEFVEDVGVPQVSSTAWLSAVFDEISATSSSPAGALEVVLDSLMRQYPSGFERMPLKKADVATCLEFFANLQKEAGAERDPDDYWFNCGAYDEARVIQELETSMAR